MQNASIKINPDTLAHHLEIAAKRYEEDATTLRAPYAAQAGEVAPNPATLERLAQQMETQAKQCATWAEALRCELRSLGFAGDDIEIDYFTE